MTKNFLNPFFASALLLASVSAQAGPTSTTLEELPDALIAKIATHLPSARDVLNLGSPNRRLQGVVKNYEAQFPQPVTVDVERAFLEGAGTKEQFPWLSFQNIILTNVQDSHVERGIPLPRNIRSLTIQDSPELTTLPTPHAEDFPNLKEFSTMGTKIRDNALNAFLQGCPALEELEVGNSPIQEVPKVKQPACLRKLTLHMNRIEHLNEESLKGFVKLTDLKVESLSLAHIDAEAFKDLKALEALSIGFTRVKSIDLTSLEGSALKVLNLANNSSLRGIGGLSQGRFPRVTRLQLNYTAFSEQEVNAVLPAFPHLQELHACGLQLTRIPAVKNPDKIKKLWIARNSIANPPPRFNHFKNLIGLSLCGNPINSLEGVFDGLSTLETLSIDGCKSLTSLNKRVFDPLTNLKELGMTDLPKRLICAKFMRSLPKSLESLSLGGTEEYELDQNHTGWDKPQEAFKYYPNLISLTLNRKKYIRPQTTPES